MLFVIHYSLLKRCYKILSPKLNTYLYIITIIHYYYSSYSLLLLIIGLYLSHRQQRYNYTTTNYPRGLPVVKIYKYYNFNS